MRLKKISLLFLLSPLLLFPEAAGAQPIRVELDGRPLKFEQAPLILDGSLLVPLRGIFEALKAEVKYNPSDRSIRATRQEKTVNLLLGSRQATIQGKTVQLSVPPRSVGGRTMVPLRFVSEALGTEVKWNSSTRTVSIVASPTPPPPNSADALQLDRVIHTATKPLYPGDTFDVIMTGSAGGQASFEIVGILGAQPLKEVRPGRYEVRFTVPPGLEVDQGVLIGNLYLAGKQALAEATRTITLVGGGGGLFVVEPAPDSTAVSTLPSVRVRFPGPIRAHSQRLYVDGVDYTRKAIMEDERRMAWTPSSPLAPGRHQLEAEALSQDGQTFTQTWAFQIAPKSPGSLAEATERQPSAETAVTDPRSEVSVRFTSPLRELTMSVDGKDVTAQSTVTDSSIRWRPDTDLAPGTHRVRVVGLDHFGRKVNEEWSFSVIP